MFFENNFSYRSNVIRIKNTYYIVYFVNCSLFYLEDLFKEEYHILCVEAGHSEFLDIPLDDIVIRESLIIFPPELLSNVNKRLKLFELINRDLVEITVLFNEFNGCSKCLCEIAQEKKQNIFYRCNCKKHEEDRGRRKIMLPSQYYYMDINRDMVMNGIRRDGNIIFENCTNNFTEVFLTAYFFRSEWPLLIICEDESHRVKVLRSVERILMEYHMLKYIEENERELDNSLNLCKLKKLITDVKLELKTKYDSTQNIDEKKIEIDINKFKEKSEELEELPLFTEIERAVEFDRKNINILPIKDIKGNEAPWNYIISLIGITETRRNKYKMVFKFAKMAMHFSIQGIKIEQLDFFKSKLILVYMKLLSRVGTDRLLFETKRAAIANRTSHNVYYKILNKINMINFSYYVKNTFVESKIRFLYRNILSMEE